MRLGPSMSMSLRLEAIWFTRFVVLTSAIDLVLMHFVTSYRRT